MWLWVTVAAIGHKQHIANLSRNSTQTKDRLQQSLRLRSVAAAAALLDSSKAGLTQAWCTLAFRMSPELYVMAHVKPQLSILTSRIHGPGTVNAVAILHAQENNSRESDTQHAISRA